MAVRFSGPMKRTAAVVILFLLGGVLGSAAETNGPPGLYDNHMILVHALQPATDPPKPTTHTIKNIEGWSVHVDNRLLHGADQKLGTSTLKLLDMRLYNIVLMVPADKVEKLRKVPIYLDRTHGKLSNMQYHPGADWLKENGYDTAMVKCVHIPDAAYFSSGPIQYQQPWCVLHELAHAYHDQVLGFENPEILAVWEKFKASGKYAAVPHMNGRMRPHYGLTDQKEFFAEMTETYFGMNDFYPFNSAELRREEPEIYAMLEKVWGPHP